MQLKNLLLPLALTATGVVAAPADDPAIVAEHAEIEKRCVGCLDLSAITNLVSTTIATYASGGYCDQVLGVLTVKFKAKFSTGKIQKAISTKDGHALEKGFCRTTEVKEKEDAKALLTACDATEKKRTSHHWKPSKPDKPQGGHEGNPPSLPPGGDCHKVWVPKEHCGGSACTCWTNHVTLPTWCKPCSHPDAHCM